ncbi:MAG: hypothetical protein LBB81_04180, partial [Treponema sp.]|nr:hypothetical protein [Treponema sp.]
MKIVCFTRKIIGLVLIAGLFFFSCPLPDSDETGTLIIRLPADSSARSAVSPELIAALKYRIVCEGSGRVSRESAPGDLVSIPLAVGQWKVTVTVLNDKRESIGSKTVEVTIKGGRTTTVPVTIPINTGEGGGTVDVTGVTLSPKSLTLTVGGEPETLTATVAPA